jgi:hypothetical protein
VSRHVNFLDFIVNNWFIYISILVVIIFGLVELDAYNLFNCFFIFCIIVILDIIGLKNLRTPRAYFNQHIKIALLRFLRDVENKKSLWSWIAFDRNMKRSKKTATT